VQCLVSLKRIHVTSVSSTVQSKDVLGLQAHRSSCNISANYGALVDLVESFESFLKCLDIYRNIQSTTAMIGILVELLFTVSLAIQ